MEVESYREIRRGTGVPELIWDSEEFLEWAKRHGARVGNGSWLELSIGRLQSVITARDEDRRAVFDRTFNGAVESQHNLSDLIHLRHIMQNLEPQDEQVLGNKLSDVLRGPESILTETPANTVARNTRFELAVAARLNSQGLPSQLKDPNPDIECRFRGKRVAIECKRLYSTDKFAERIEEAELQLKDRPGNRGADIKLIFVDMTRLVTGGRLHAQGDQNDAMHAIIEAQKKIAQQASDLMIGRRMRDIDAIVLVYQDYIEPTDGEYILLGVTQSAVVLNSLPLRNRRRLTERFARKMSPQGAIYD